MVRALSNYVLLYKIQPQLWPVRRPLINILTQPSGWDKLFRYHRRTFLSLSLSLSLSLISKNSSLSLSHTHTHTNRHRMPALSSSIVSVRIPRTDSLSGSSLMRVNQSLGSGKLFVSPTGLAKAKPLKYRKALTVQASFVLETVFRKLEKRNNVPNMSMYETEQQIVTRLVEVLGMVEDQVVQVSLLVALYWEEFLLEHWVVYMHLRYISKVLVGEQRKQLMRKLPKFIYDEEKALEKTRKILTAKIEQLNSAIDEVATQIHGDNTSKSTKSKRAPVRIKPEEEVEDTTDYYIV
ncbi:hypothetical protein RHGRI_030353 [Rhododendron griersonianum]|uniref:Calcium uniporter protein n=1 Tax=Rhododendron griersonianum TaxID=479676 RepID=A0AAV6IMR2_9ERIC|nr:hypothetical protein RHGRI_030353 [Rhododendron griersonianum]